MEIARLAFRLERLDVATAALEAVLSSTAEVPATVRREALLLASTVHAPAGRPELALEGFAGGASMRRYLIGAMAMGFGGMLAGGCAVGAGLSGAAVFTITSWVTLSTMWAAAALTDRLIDQPDDAALDQPMPGLPAAGVPA
jgi:uncharacterized membrane protein YedE/YeeE